MHMKIKKKTLLKIVLLIVLLFGVFSVILLISGTQNAQAAETKVSYHGDVDGDGDISAADARLSLRACVGLEDYAPDSYEFFHADYDRDGEITASDARMILRTAVGLEPLIESDYIGPGESSEIPLSEEELEKLKEEEETKKRDLETESMPTETEKGPEGPTFAGDGINTCMFCGLPCHPDEYGNDACAFGGCTRSMAAFTCMHCGEEVPANTCHTCLNPTYIITEEPVK